VLPAPALQTACTEFSSKDYESAASTCRAIIFLARGAPMLQQNDSAITLRSLNRSLSCQFKKKW
jgi:hypothetical protein